MPKPLKKQITILASDPGKTNHAIAALKASCANGILKVEIVAVKMMWNRVEDFKQPLYPQIATYLKEVTDFQKQHLGAKPDVMIIERFMGRGLRGGLAEYVTLMLGAQVNYYGPLVSDDRLHVIGASLWKTAANRVFDLKALYATPKLSPHMLDAVLMGMWAAAKYYNVPTFKNLRSRLQRIRLAGRIGKVGDGTAIAKPGRKKAKR